MSGAEATVVSEKARRSRRRVPRALVYEMRRGKPIYYRGYEKVLAGELPPEAVMGTGKLQAWLIDVIVAFLHRVLDPQRYKILFNEVGFYIGPRSWRSLDIAIFDRAAVLAEGLTSEYVRTPPLVVIEVDTKADLAQYEGQVEWYIREKVDDLLNAGVRRVIWYTTPDRRVLVAEPNRRWFLTTWDDPIEVWEGVTLDLNALLAEEGIDLRQVQEEAQEPSGE